MNYYEIASFIYTCTAVVCIITGVICCTGQGKLLELEDLQGIVFIFGSLGLFSLSLVVKRYGEKERTAEGDDDGEDQNEN